MIDLLAFTCHMRRKDLSQCLQTAF